MTTETPMTPQDAGNLLYHQVYVPTFFSKLAELGFEPNSPAQAQSLLRQASVLRARHIDQQAKQAAVTGDFVLMAEQRLNSQPTDADVTGEIAKYAAAVVQSRPDLAQAAIVLQDDTARQLVASQSA